MTNPKIPDRYPFEYMELLERLMEEPEARVRIPCSDRRVAQGLSKRLYDFRTAVLNDPECERFHIVANKLMIKKTDSGLLVLNRDHSEEAIQMRKAIEDSRKTKEE